ncbi:hypothetical protein [uncultured Psychrosphaera sp.]|uniref:hypothetical protein n=1 Tax=uncultured Psychrosphaera sp. TaxID=1403522 RepID=UPI00261DEF71|nr:hypothetical protein [uncultured Psychrosphaera sp.]
MFNRLLMICLISVFMVGCSHKRAHKVVVHERDKIAESFYLTDVTFSEGIEDGAFKTDCAMLSGLEKSILDSSKTSALKVLPSNSITPEQYELKVEYTNVESHKWLFMAIRPSSAAEAKASIVKNGKVLHSTTQSISSAVAFGACDRLEKISLAQGRYISKWLSNYAK